MKFQSRDRDRLQQFVEFLPPAEGQIVGSLKSLDGVLPFLKEILDWPHEDFLRKLFSLELETDDSQSKEMARIVQYTLVDFHKQCLQPPFITGHERTGFVDIVVPVFSAMAKVTGLIQFYWCEKTLECEAAILSLNNDHTPLMAGRKLLDAIGVTANATTATEMILIECSRYPLSHGIPSHAMDDAVKLVSCSISSLLQEAELRKGASFSKFCELKILAIQVVKNKLTLSYLNMSSSGKWQWTEHGWATIPLTWDTRIQWIGVFDIVSKIIVKKKKKKEH
ncbi:hypothetical protein DM01DRAFT_1315612 [Hesseltinella vesiculosa]|uniref:Uncharacterized protein n=1 Tax=Hesseltinella vesiculosa TaxID=101127 RepID=A0A1X2GW03_9FUNG|nr:hypothetical protein DM01DRAFT_1315612 [Hesseltinella vesiculosa]